MEERMLSDEELLALIKKNSGGGGGTSDYTQLSNLPQINSVELTGNKSLSDLGIASEESLAAILDAIAEEFDATATYAVGDYTIEEGVLYRCTAPHTGAWDANDFTETTVSDEILSALSAISGILDGADIDSFGDVETALADKQGTITAGLYIQKSGDTISVKRDVSEDVDEVMTLTHDTSGGTNKINAVLTVGGETIDSETITTSGGTFHDLVQISFNGQAVRFKFKYLVASKTQSAGYENYIYNEYTDTFVETIGEESKLIIKSELDTALSGKQDTLTFDDVPTANSNNPVKSGGVKSAIDAAVSSAYHHAGTKTCVELVAGLLVAANEGNVYNMTDSGTTTADFIEGAGQPIKAGDNVGIAKISDGVYKFDLLSGFVDTTNFVQKSVTAGLLQNDGTVDTTIQGDVDSLKSGLTNLDNEVNGDATTYPYADVITIEDAIPANVADCSVKIEPVQDLHGYDHPWVGGANKNKINIADKASSTSGDVTASCSNGVITLSGTASAQTTFSFPLGSDINLTPSLYKIAYNNTAASSYIAVKFCNDGSVIHNWTPNVVNRVISDWTAAEDETIDEIKIEIATGYPTNMTLSIVVMDKDGTDTSFSPYSNICPISGHTEASVQRDGRNKLPLVLADIKTANTDGTWNGNAYTFNGVTFTVQTDNDGNVVGILVNGTASSGMSFILYDSIFTAGSYKVNGCPSGGSNSSYRLRLRNITNDIGTGANFELSEDTSIITEIVITNGYAIPTGGLTFYPMIRLATETDATFVPYAGKTYTIALGDTIYGGTVDFDSGVMTVTHGFTTFEGDNVEGWILSSNGIRVNTGISISTIKKPRYNSDVANILSNQFNKTSSDGTYYGLIGISVNTDGYISVCQTGETMVLADWLTYLASNPLQVCYELATPFTVQLTPQQIQLLQGQNTLTASTGDISVTVNGVSGAIGAVQEQVNELAEDVADVTADVSSVTTKVSDMAKGYYSRNVVSGKWYKIADISATTWMIHNTIIAFNGAMLKHIVLRYDNESHTFNNNLTKINSLNGLVGYVGIKFGTNSAEVYVKAGHTGISTYTVLTDGVEGSLNYHKPIETAYTDSDMDLIES